MIITDYEIYSLEYPINQTQETISDYLLDGLKSIEPIFRL